MQQIDPYLAHVHLSSLDSDHTCDAGASKGFFDNSVGSQFATRKIELPKKSATRSAPRKASSGGFFDSSVGAQFANRSGSANASDKPESYPVSVSDSEDEDTAEEVDSENAFVSAW